MQADATGGLKDVQEWIAETEVAKKAAAATRLAAVVAVSEGSKKSTQRAF